MLNEFSEIAKKLRGEFQALTFDGFLNLYKSASEIFYLDIPEPLRGRLAYPYDLFKETFRVDSAEGDNHGLSIVYRSSFFEILNAVIPLHDEGRVIVCDDLVAWKTLRAARGDNACLEALKTIYKVFARPSVNGVFDFLNNGFLFPDRENLYLELNARFKEVKDLAALFKLLPEPLAALFKRNGDSFGNFYDNALEAISSSVAEKLEALEPLREFIERDKNFEWAYGLGMLAFASPKIKLGVETALKHASGNVVFCASKPCLPKLAISEAIPEAPKIFNEKLDAWRKAENYRVYTNLAPKTHSHPLLGVNYAMGEPLVYENPTARAFANPPLACRQIPKLSATAFQQLVRDPYGFYANHILKLKYLPRILSEPTAKDFGVLAHQALEALITDGFMDYARVPVLWRKRLERIVGWVRLQLGELRGKRSYGEKTLTEELTFGSRKIALSARIDALIQTDSGNLAVNFKTGTPPLKVDVLRGYSPQLAIEIFLARMFFKGDCQGEFWHLKGTQPAGEIRNVPITQEFLEKNVAKIIEYYLFDQSVFLACPWPNRALAHNHYASLERIGDD